MAFRDLHHNVHVQPGIVPVVATSNNTPWVSAIIDTQGYDSCEFLLQAGVLGSVGSTYAVLVEDGNQANLSDNAAVASKFLVGTVASAGFTQAADQNKCKKIGYIGDKRYVRVTVTPTGNSAAAYMSGMWLLGHPRSMPTPNVP